MNRYELVADCLEKMSDDDIIEVWNEFCASVSDYDERIHYIGEVDDYFANCNASDIFEIARDGFDTYDDYFVDGVYVESFNDIYEHVDIERLVTYIVDSDDNLSNAELLDLMLDDEYIEADFE